MRKCPKCGYEGENFKVFYTSPLLYWCPLCKKKFGDPTDGAGPKILRGEAGIKARPEMYSEEDKARIRKALTGLCPSCGGDPDVDCSCNLRNA
jgi:hypothetical protein